MSTTRRPFDFLQRTEALLGEEALARLAAARVAIAGLGGVGGALAATLVRLGVGKFRIADPGCFDLPDLNRQWAATHETIGRNKATVYGELLRSINPAAEVEVFSEGLTQDNVGPFVADTALVVDALDVQVPAPLRLALVQGARAGGSYTMLPPIIGFGTVVALARPDGPGLEPVLALLARYRDAGSLPGRLDAVFAPEVLAAMQRAPQGVIPSLALATTLVASVACTEALMVLAPAAFPGARDPICLPQLTLVDLSRGALRVIDVSSLTGTTCASVAA